MRGVGKYRVVLAVIPKYGIGISKDLFYSSASHKATRLDISFMRTQYLKIWPVLFVSEVRIVSNFYMAV